MKFLLSICVFVFYVKFSIALECFHCNDELAKNGWGSDGSCEYGTGRMKIVYCAYDQACKSDFHNGVVYARGCVDKFAFSTCFSNRPDTFCPCYFDFCNRF